MKKGKWSIVFKDKNGEYVTGIFNGGKFGVVAVALDYLGVEYDVFYKGVKVEKRKSAIR